MFPQSKIYEIFGFKNITSMTFSVVNIPVGIIIIRKKTIRVMKTIFNRQDADDQESGPEAD